MIASSARAGLLEALDALEQRAEVSVAEALVSTPLDDLVEERARAHVVVQRRCLAQETLGYVFVFRAADQDLEPLELFDLLRRVRDPELREWLGEREVIRLRRVHEVDVTPMELFDRPQDVVARERDVLDAGPAVVV